MENDSTSKRLRRRLILGTGGLILGGMAPLLTGIIGIWSYLKQGYFISKTGELIEGPSGLVISFIFVVAGLGVIVVAILKYRRVKHRNA